jgi:hypothetical protein
MWRTEGRYDWLCAIMLLPIRWAAGKEGADCRTCGSVCYGPHRSHSGSDVLVSIKRLQQARNRDVAERPKIQLAVTQPSADRPISGRKHHPSRSSYRPGRASFEHGLLVPGTACTIVAAGGALSGHWAAVLFSCVCAGLDRCKI